MKILNPLFKSKVFDNLNIFFAKKIFKLFKIFFVETNLNKLPDLNYPLKDIDADLKGSELYSSSNTVPYLSYSHLSDLVNIIYEEKKKFVFFDYGAGNLNLFFYLNKRLDNLKYYFKDQISVEEKVKKIINQKRLNNLILGQYEFSELIDVLYFGSSLQYIDNYKDKISPFFQKARYILIAQTPFFENQKLNEKIILKQLNMHPVINYLYMFNFSHFINFMEKNNYILMEKNINKVTKFLNFKNFDKKKYINLNMYDLLFKYKK